MNFNDQMEKALAQARELQAEMYAAANKAAEDMKPQIADAMHKAQELQRIFNHHAAASSELAAKQAESASKHLREMIELGSEAMRESAEQTKATAQKMAEQAKAVVDAATRAVKPPG